MNKPKLSDFLPKAKPLTLRRRTVELQEVDGKQVEVDVLHEEIEGATINLVGPESAQWEQALRTMRKAKLEVADDAKVDHIAAFKDEWTFLLASVITGWNEEFFGVPFSPEAAHAILKNPETNWVKNQIDEFVGKKANFLSHSK